MFTDVTRAVGFCARPSTPLGSRQIAKFTAPEVLAVLRPIEGRGLNETPHRALQRYGQIFRYAIATGRASREIKSGLRSALAAALVENRAAITEPPKIGAVLRAPSAAT